MTVTSPAPLAFPLVTVRTDIGAVTVPCEPINEWFAITPVFGMDKDGNSLLDGGFTITHRSTGLNFVNGPGCIECCRRSGKELAAMDVDWSTLTAGNGHEWVSALPEEARFALSAARAVEWSCDTEFCEPAPSPA